MLMLGLLGAVLLATRFARAGLRCLLASILLLVIFGLSPLPNALILPLEQRFPAWESARGVPDGIIALGGAFDPRVAAGRGEVSLNESAERMTSAVELARRYPKTRIVFSGGVGQIPEAELAKRLFGNLGVPEGWLITEDRSLNTDENANFTKAIVDPKPDERWLLITSANHVPRAIGAFRRAGFPVEAYPVDWRTRGLEDLARAFSKASEGLKLTDTGAHEWVGLLVYWLTGRSSELFPGP
jgi:uncharacterized SAM-binding protein YcdF (DUF218 family)